MSLLDDVSIVVTPNGYKAGELYAVVPEYSEGSELVTNGDFATDSDWTLGSGWSIGSGSLNAIGAGNYAVQTNVLAQSTNAILKVQWTQTITSGTRLRFFARNYNDGGSETVLSGSATDGGVYSSSNCVGSGTYTIYVSVTNGYSFKLLAESGNNATVDNVSVKEYTSADMDVTRETAATRVDEDGLVNYAEVLGSEEVTNGDFSDGSANWFNPDGAATFSNNSVTISGASGNRRINQTNVTSPITSQFKLQYEITEKVGTSDLKVYTTNSGSAAYTIVPSTIGVHTFYFTSNLTTFYFNFSNSSGSITIDNVSVKEVTRDNVPRIDYTGGGCPHILAEPMRTNLIPYSEDFSQSAWQKSNITTTPNSITSPDGTLNAYKLTKPTSSPPRLFELSVYPSTGVHTFTSFYKNLDGDSVLIRLDGGGNTANCNVDLTTNTLVNSGANIISSNITQLSDGWIRVSVTANILSTSWVLDAVNLFDLSVGSSVYIYGAQLEEASYATSYIPTSGSTVTRNADTFIRDGIGSLINDSEGVLFVEMAKLNGNTVAPVISLNNGTSSQTVALYYFSTDEIAFDIISSSPNVSGISSSYNTDNFNKIALKYKSGDIALWVNGVEVLTKTNTFSLTGLNKISFDYGNDTYSFYGKVRQLQVYNTALTDEQLLQLTGESGTDFYESYAEMATALTYTIQ